MALPRLGTPERRAGAMAILATLHLVTVSVFIWTDVAESSDSVVHRGLRTYRNVAGIFRDYRFFAPNVASDMRAGFLLERADGSRAFEDFLSDSLEITLRYLCIVRASMNDKRAREVMARSWAALMLGNHPEATQVTVVTQTYDLPNLHQYAAGKRPRWATVYAGVFDRRGDER